MRRWAAFPRLRGATSRRAGGPNGSCHWAAGAQASPLGTPWGSLAALKAAAQTPRAAVQGTRLGASGVVSLALVAIGLAANIAPPGVVKPRNGPASLLPRLHKATQSWLVLVLNSP